MSTISTTITTNIYYGPGQTYLSPLTITNTGAVITSAVSKGAVEGGGGGTLVNRGTIVNSAAGGNGVQITGPGGSINNY
jgi:hypothetical protein